MSDTEQFCPITRRPHEYSLPVEWEYQNYVGDMVHSTVAGKRVVTVLRCACGAESKR